jgi:hypothetical protein
MWMKLSAGIFALFGIVVMGIAIFEKKEEIDKWQVSSTSLTQMFIDKILKSSPTIVKRIGLFLMGLGVTVLCTLGLIWG